MFAQSTCALENLFFTDDSSDLNTSPLVISTESKCFCELICLHGSTIFFHLADTALILIVIFVKLVPLLLPYTATRPAFMLGLPHSGIGSYASIKAL